MEDYEAQEHEFWRKLAEIDMSRSQMLKRSFAAAAGLTVLSSPGIALAGRRLSAAAPPLHGKSVSIKEMLAEAKKEGGTLNTIALPHDWANYGAILTTFKKKYGFSTDEQNPDGSSAQENQAIVSLKGDSRAPDVVDDSPAFAISGTAQGLFTKYFNSNFGTIPRSMKDTRGYWVGDYWGAISIGYNASIVSTPPKTFADLLKPEYKGKVALNGSPLTSGSAIAGVFAAALSNGGSLSNVGPGIDWFAKLKSVGNWIPVQANQQVVRLVGVAREAFWQQALELNLDRCDRIGIQELAQVLAAQELSEQLAVERERLGAPFGERRIARVHELRHIREKE